MNRENKLALIIGFTLILVVGVLVSDHLSRANSTQLNSGLELAETSDHKPLSGGTIGTIGATIAANVPPRRAQPLDPVNPGLRDLVTSPPSRTLTLGDPSPMVINQNSKTVNPESNSLGRFAQATSGAVDRFLGIYQNSALPRALELDRDGPSAVITEPKVSIPTSITYEVKANDNLFQIAKRYLGDGERWREIRDDNTGLVGSEGEIALGAQLRVRVLEPVSVRNGVTQTRRPPLNDTPRSIDINTRSYTVSSGDVLSTIAQNELGTVRRMDEILSLNPGLNGDADSIRLGMKLKLPVR